MPWTESTCNPVIKKTKKSNHIRVYSYQFKTSFFMTQEDIVRIKKILKKQSINVFRYVNTQDQYTAIRTTLK